MQDLALRQQEHQTAMDNEVRDLLGEETWRAWNEYKATMGVRHEVSQMRTTLAMKGAPLEEHQVKPVQRALVEAQQRQMQEWARTAPSFQVPTENGGPTAKQQLAYQEYALRRQREHHEQLRDSLRSALNDAQLRHIAEQQDAQLKLQEAHLRMMRAQADAEASGRIAPTDDAVAGEAIVVTTNNALLVPPNP